MITELLGRLSVRTNNWVGSEQDVGLRRGRGPFKRFEGKITLCSRGGVGVDAQDYMDRWQGPSLGTERFMGLAPRSRTRSVRGIT